MKERQLSFFIDIEQNLGDWTVEKFSADGFANDSERCKIESKFLKVTEVSDAFNRQSVSFQLSKKECIHRWLKYKEGFSADLVENLIDELNIPTGGVVMEPFLGSGTTALVCKMNGINSIGFDVLPMTKISIKAKDALMMYDVMELRKIYEDFCNAQIPPDYDGKFPYISMTDGAFPDDSEREVVYFSEWLDNYECSDIAKNLFKLCIINSLETSSYTRKDGQYLAWDSRSKKIINANKEREKVGKKPIDRLNKGCIPPFSSVLKQEFQKVISDVEHLQKSLPQNNATIDFKEGSSLLELPKMKGEILDGVITSPPYCNRYDYTRTYALEMNYLGFTSTDISTIRQNLISCTVENKSKFDFLRDYYSQIGRTDFFDHVIDIINNCKVLNEVKEALQLRNEAGEINNKGVLRMVDGYFMDLTFIYAEVFRLSKHGASVAVVNDNVRYAGEVIPVDFISSQLAEDIGYKVKKIYTLKQKKGNSSQQMAKYGRVALRKSITIWTKP